MAIFGIGSLVAALAQGVIFGALTQAVAAGGGVFEGGAMDFLTPYTALTGIAAALVYAALGAGFLRFKGDDGVRVRAGTMGRVLMGFAIVLSLVAAVSIGGTAAPMLLDEPGRAVPFWILAAVAAVAAAVALATFGDPKRRDLEDMVPFLALCFTIVAGFLAFVVGRYPTLLPPALTVQSAVSPNPTLIFLLIGVGANIPLVLFYNWYAHHVFRGRYREAVVRRPTGVSASQQALAADGPAATKGDAR
jgi:cytochrome d ubiquinol oxidase subunit II